MSDNAAGEAGTFGITLTLEEGYRFSADASLPGVSPFHVDEMPPLGAGTAPNPSRVLAAAMASCLGSSLIFCLAKSRIRVQSLTVHAEGRMTRNSKGRLRVGSMTYRLEPVVAPEDVSRMQRCLELFQDFCVVTESVRAGIPVDVSVDTQVHPPE